MSPATSALGEDLASSAMRFPRQTSSVSEALDVTGDYWMLRLLGRFFTGAETWGDLAKDLGVSPTTLSKRLKQLTDAGCATKVSEGRSIRYRLTEKGLGLFPVIAAMDEWRLRWDNPTGLALSPWNHDCGAPLRCRSSCAHCDRDVRLDEVTHQLTDAGKLSVAPAKPRHFRNAQPTTAPWREGDADASRLLEVMGDRRASQLLAAFNRGLGRFDDLVAFTRLHPAIVSERLRKLQLLGLAHMRLYREAPDRYLYGLSASARDIFPATMQMMQWGDRWLFGEGREPVAVMHNPCGERLKVAFCCVSCHRPVRFEDLTYRGGGAEPLLTS